MVQLIITTEAGKSGGWRDYLFISTKINPHKNEQTRVKLGVEHPEIKAHSNRQLTSRIQDHR
jgi:hypothetical protein